MKGLTGMVLGAYVALTGCGPGDEVVAEPATAMGKVISANCESYFGNGIYELIMGETRVNFTEKCESLPVDFLQVSQYIGEVSCNEVDKIPSGEYALIDGFYGYGFEFESEKIIQWGPEFKQIWPLEEEK